MGGPKRFLGSKFIVGVHIVIIILLSAALMDVVSGQIITLVAETSESLPLENDPRVNIYRLNQIEQKVRGLEDGQKNNSTLLIASLVGVVVNFATYIIMNRKKSNK